MAKDNFTEFQKKVEEMIASTAELSGLSVEVGLPDDRIHNPSGLTLAEIGAIHEFGLGNVPERSFLRGAVHSGAEEIKKNFEIVAKRVVNGEDPMQEMDNLAQFGQGLVQEYIAEGKAQPPKIKTKANENKNIPLINTGEMRQSIIGVVVSD